MASLQSTALRSMPGYVQRPVVATPATVMPTTPDIPTAPDFGGRVNVGTAPQQQWIRTQLAALPGKYAPVLGAAQANAKAALAGYGGWSFKTDDPGTAYNEGLDVQFNPNAGLGEREQQAMNAERSAANSRGFGSSSFANKAVGAALQRMNEQARGIVNQYAAQIASTLGQQQSEQTSLTGELVGLFGQDAAYFAENPVKPPDWMAPPGTIGQVWAGYHQPDENALASMYPDRNFEYRTEADGRITVIAHPRTSAAAAPAPAPPSGPSTWQPNAAGNIVTNIRISDLTPHSASLLAQQYPGYRVVRAGNGMAVLKRV